MYGWAGTIVRIDLTKEKVLKESVEKYNIRKFIGGRGINAQILYNEEQSGLDPYDPENRLIFGVGPLVGTTAPSSGRVIVTSKSPMTGLYGDSSIGGSWGPELKYAGYDNIVIQGKSEKPVYVWIKNENVEIRNADHIWGNDTFETQKVIKEEIDPEVKVICIGPGGENLVRFACIKGELKHAAGRPGLGAVMGSKRLKAIAVRGTKGISIARPKRFLEISERAHRVIRNNPHYRWATTVGEGFGVNSIDLHTDMETVAIKNFSGEYLIARRWKDFFKKFSQAYGIKPVGCYGCPMPCNHFVRVPGLPSSTILCAPLVCWAQKILNSKPELMYKYITLADKYGIDSISTSGVISVMMELYEQRIITTEDTEGIPLEWGNDEAVTALIDKITKREGFGDLLAEGSVRAAKKIGKNAIKYVSHTRGLDDWPDDARTSKSMALAMALSARGDFTRGWATAEWTDLAFKTGSPTVAGEDKESVYSKIKKTFGSEKAGYHHEYEGKALATVIQENNIAIMDCMGLCKSLVWDFPQLDFLILNESRVPSCDFHSLNLPQELFSAATGIDISNEELHEVAERVITSERVFNVREGITRENDTVAEKYFEVPIPEGMHEGEKLDRKEFERMKDQYYELRGWDGTSGIPSRKKLEELDLQSVNENIIKYELMK